MLSSDLSPEGDNAAVQASQVAENRAADVNGFNEPLLVIDLVAGEDPSLAVVAEAFRSFGVTLHRHSVPASWFTNLSRANHSPADASAPEMVVFAGDAHQMLAEDWVPRAKASYPAATVVVALTNPSLRSVALLLKQGIRAFIELPSSADRVVDEIGWLVHQSSAARVKVRSAHANRANLSKLTRAEIDVLRLMLDGQANKQIAQDLSIGLRTVELRRSKIMRKMQASTVAQLMRFVHESGVDVFVDN